MLNQADLFVDGLSGDDDIVVRTAAPNEADWDVNLRIAGGSPSSGQLLDSDRLSLETPNLAGGLDRIVFNPTGNDTGNIIIDENNTGLYEAGGTDSLITMDSFVFNRPPAAFIWLISSAEELNGFIIKVKGHQQSMMISPSMVRLSMTLPMCNLQG
ncbi:MAG: hypothetical protein U0905_14975 [Pirellulales bacterium]